MDEQIEWAKLVVSGDADTITITGTLVYDGELWSEFYFNGTNISLYTDFMEEVFGLGYRYFGFTRMGPSEMEVLCPTFKMKQIEGDHE